MPTKYANILFSAVTVALMAMVFQTAQANGESQKALQETYDLSNFPNEVLVLMDTTHVGDITSGHVVATLPNEDGECDEYVDDSLPGDAPFQGLAVLVGVAPDVAEIALQNTGISTGRTVNFAGQNVTTCVFHLDIEPDMIAADGTEIKRITDVAFINGVACPGRGQGFCSLPSGTSIGVAANLGDANDNGNESE